MIAKEKEDVGRKLAVTAEKLRLKAEQLAEIAKQLTMTVLDHVIDLRGIPPQFLRMDNGPEFIADVMIDWCRQTRITTAFVDPGSPWQNGHIESFNGKLRDELLSREVFDSMRELKILLEDHRNTHNFYRPHSSLGYLTPHEYANRWHQQNNRLVS